MKSRSLMLGSLAFVVCGLAYCSFGPDEYTGPFPDPAPEEDSGGGTGGGGGGDDGGGSTDDGGGSMDDGGASRG